VRVNKIEEYKKMDEDSLLKELKELKKELFKLRFSHAMNGLDNPKKMNETKKNIARVNTIITMKKTGKEIKTREFSKKTIEKKEVKNIKEKEEDKSKNKEKDKKKVGGKN